MTSLFMKIWRYLPAALLLGLFVLWAPNTDSKDFTPDLLKLSAPFVVQYNFDRIVIEIPISVHGTDATIVFSVFQHDIGRNVNSIHNGFLGWHYVNKIDTCVYVAEPQLYQPGNSIITWDGRNTDGNFVEAGRYTYYLWAYDSVGEKQPAMYYSSYYDGEPVIVSRDEEGNQLGNPILYSAPDVYHTESTPAQIIRQKWIIGYDPEDASLIETTAYSGWIDRNALAVNPDNHDLFFTSMYNPGGTHNIRHYRWIPNGEAQLITDWGSQGEYARESWVPPQWFSSPGITAYEHYIYMISMTERDGIATSELVNIDVEEGSENIRTDISEWWVDTNDTDRDGVKFSGPTCMKQKDNFLFFGSRFSCLFQMINPYADNFSMNDMLLYSNGNGDFIGDINVDETAANQWLCHDSRIDAVDTGLGVDDNLFTVFPLSGYGSVSFGVLAPDGTGIGYYPFSGVNEGNEIGITIIDDDTAYDGMYLNGKSSETGANGVWYVAHDCFKGVISSSFDCFARDHYEVHYGPSENSAEIILKKQPVTPSGTSFECPDEIGVFTPLGRCVGRKKLGKFHTLWGQAIIRVYGDDPETNEIDGMREGESFTFKIWESKGDREYEVQAFFSSDLRTFRKKAEIYVDSLIVLEATDIEDQVNLETPRLVRNHPNPFNPSTTIEFSLSESGYTTLYIYNTSGQKVRELASEYLSTGTHRLFWDGVDDTGNKVSSGTYIYRLKTGDFTISNKIMLMR